jgi:hypothetical protein
MPITASETGSSRICNGVGMELSLLWNRDAYPPRRTGPVHGRRIIFD